MEVFKKLINVVFIKNAIVKVIIANFEKLFICFALSPSIYFSFTKEECRKKLWGAILDPTIKTMISMYFP